MNVFWLDASALIKFYISETGSHKMSRLFSRIPLNQMQCLHLTIGEVISIFVRHKNNDRYRQITKTLFNQQMQHFENDFIHSVVVNLKIATKDQISESWKLIKKHSINSKDDCIRAIDHANEIKPDGKRLILVSSDKRLIRAARSEKIITFDPETDTQNSLEVVINAQ